MIRKRVPNDWRKLRDCQRVQRALAVNERFKVLHLGDAVEDQGQLVPIETAIIEQHSVDDGWLKELARFSQSLAVTIT